MRTTALALVAAAASAVSLASVAAAAPINAKNSTPILLVCPSGTYQTVVNGNGPYTPAHSVTSNTVLIPIAFGPFTGTFTDANGVMTTQVDPGSSKGSATPTGAAIQTCTYYLQFSFPDGSSFSGSGTVTGFIPGR